MRERKTGMRDGGERKSWGCGGRRKRGEQTPQMTKLTERIIVVCCN